MWCLKYTSIAKKARIPKEQVVEQRDFLGETIECAPLNKFLIIHMINSRITFLRGKVIYPIHN